LQVSQKSINSFPSGYDLHAVQPFAVAFPLSFFLLPLPVSVVDTAAATTATATDDDGIRGASSLDENDQYLRYFKSLT
jgi:hypothetical protein